MVAIFNLQLIFHSFWLKVVLDLLDLYLPVLQRAVRVHTHPLGALPATRVQRASTRAVLVREGATLALMVSTALVAPPSATASKQASHRNACTECCLFHSNSLLHIQIGCYGTSSGQASSCPAGNYYNKTIT